jgi:hypothetical protein
MRPTRSRFSLTVFMSRGALFELAGIDAGEGQRTDEGVVHDLEGQHRQRRIVGSLRVVSASVLTSMPSMAGTSIGLGR